MTQVTAESEVDADLPESRQAVTATAGGIPIRNIWHMLLYAWDQPDRIGAWRGDVERAPTLDALLATILANLIEQRLRIGLGRDYATHVDEIPGIRGRVLFGETVRRMSLPHGKTVCRYQVFTPDVPKNRIVRSTLAKLVDAGQFGSPPLSSRLRSRFRKVVRALDAARLVTIGPADIAREQLRRHGRDYTLMLAICRLIQSYSMPTEAKGAGHALSANRDELQLHDIYEKFVARFFALKLADWRVQTQPQWKWPNSNLSPLLPAMRPDIVLQHYTTRQVIVIDTKFTPHALTLGQWGKQTYSPDHLYQMYAYVKSQADRSKEHAAATGILLYPTAQHSLSESVMIQGNLFRWETISLAANWQDIEARLMAIPGT